MSLSLHRHVTVAMCLFFLTCASMVGVADAESHQFPLSCDDCHGMPPIDSSYRNVSTGGFRGNHATHNPPSVAPQATCEKCHAGSGSYISGHRDGRIGMTSNINDSPHSSRATYAKASFFNQTSNPQMRSCSNVNCHFENGTPQWGSEVYNSTAACSGCHTAPGMSGAHDKHDPYFPLARNGCAKCHPDYVTGLRFSHATSAGHADRKIKVEFSEGSYSGPGRNFLPSQSGQRTFGSCSGTYCHSGGAEGSGVEGIIPDWNGNTLACTACHGNDRESGRKMASGKHSAHIDNYSTLGIRRSFGCVQCHANTVSDNRTVSNKINHSNRVKNYSGARAGRVAVAGSGRCSTAYCHSTGTRDNQFWNMTAANWYSSRTLSCNGCHGTSSMPDGAFAAFTSVAGESTFENRTAIGRRNSHRAHVSGRGAVNSTGCAVCHRDTVDTVAGNRLRDYSSLHLNGSRDVIFTPAAGTQSRYSSATQECMNVYCHSNGSRFDNLTTNYKTMRWGGEPMTCSSCHSDPSNADGLSGRHGKHTASTIYDSACSRCHRDTVDAAGKIINRAKHADNSKDIAFSEGGTYDSASKACSTYCHSDANSGRPTVEVKWSDKNVSMACYSCHKGSSATDNKKANCDAIGGQWSSAKGYCTPDLVMESNGHRRLVGPQWIRKYPCTFCHNATVASVTSVAGKPPVDGSIVPGKSVNGMFSSSRHVNKVKDIQIDPFWKIDGDRKRYDPPSYDPLTKICNNLYCHSDGTTDPESIRAFPWNERTPQGEMKHAECNSCHGHPLGDNCAACHDGKKKFLLANMSTALSVQTAWAPGEEWKSAMPMFPNEGINKPRANSHPRHLMTQFSCDECHYNTIAVGGDCRLCHDGSTGKMGEASHLNPAYHVNKVRDVDFRQGGTYKRANKSCSGTVCHSGADPQWGASVDNAVICITCHGTWTNPDSDDYGKANGIKAQINLTEWVESGHGRTSAKGNYKSGNPPASFPGNPCWYCHDNKVLHNMTSVNPFRLKMHTQFSNRYEHECVYCHMSRTQDECLSCHNAVETLAPQMGNITSSHTATAKWPNLSSVVRPDHKSMPITTSCLNDQGATKCHSNDMRTHNTGAGVWTAEQKEDVRNQYMMMGVCLQCHDDDSNDKCAGCHGVKDSNGNFVKTAFGNISVPRKYKLGYDPGTGYIQPKKAKASSVHFGHKHYQDFLANGTGWNKGANGKPTGTWKGGKFCWDCHDPHGDTNIYMIHGKVATETDGKFGIPAPGKRVPVYFVQKTTGEDYARSNVNPVTGRIDGICNVCHATGSQHYRADGGDGHNSSTRCTQCHEHRFTDSHADNQSCNSCHGNKPVPRHSGFGLPRDCVKCHTGNVGARVDVLGQFRGQSHHVQGTAVTNKHCYQCHWESTSDGLINVQYHEGYNFKNYSTKKDKKVDLVLYGPGTRPSVYRLYSSEAGRATAVNFLAANISSPNLETERKESAIVTNHCISCHSDQNNDTKPFGDCKTPRQYAWDLQSIAARYSQKGVTKWGKYSSATVNNKYRVTKALSAHGNAANNQGGWNPATGTDSSISDSRPGFSWFSTLRKNVQCFDCHNSHGSKAGGTTSSYVSYSGLKNGGNLKEVTSGKGGYKVNYFAKAKADGSGVVNPYNAGAGQCFDCHMTPMKGSDGSSGTPWGYNSTFGATQPIKGYRDAYRFGDRNYTDPVAGQVYKLASAYKQQGKGSSILGGHFKKTSPLKTDVADNQKIDGLCTPCHDPHGVSPSLGDNQPYAVPLLKDTWMSSPYKEDFTVPTPSGANSQGNAWGTAQYSGRKFPSVEPPAYYNIDRNTLGTSSGGLKGPSRSISQTDSQFAGLCTKCHTKKALLGRYTSSMSPNTASWKSVERIHASNKGWGTNKEHNFTCSKCHQPHNSGLPRLMQTNCLDYQHRGNVTGGGTAWSSLKALANIGATYYRDSGCNSAVYQLRGYPTASVLGGGGYSSTTPESTISCHISRFSGGPEVVPAIRDFKVRGPASPLPTQWPDQNYWNNVTPWPLSK